MPFAVRALAPLLLIFAAVPACDDGDDGTTSTTVTPAQTSGDDSTASSTGNDSSSGEYLCEAGADCLDDSTCGDMECMHFNPLTPEAFRACAVPCDDDDDCVLVVAGAARCGELGACEQPDGSFAGLCHDL